MGIVCHCPNGHRVKVKDHLAGKTGICPSCEARFRIPLAREAPADTAPSGTETMPTPIAEASTASWCIAVPGGQPSDAMSGSALLEWLTSGTMTGGELVWRSDWSDWRPVAEVFPDHVPPAFPQPRAAW
jgi:hypothetical protein